MFVVSRGRQWNAGPTWIQPLQRVAPLISYLACGMVDASSENTVRSIRKSDLPGATRVVSDDLVAICHGHTLDLSAPGQSSQQTGLRSSHTSADRVAT